MSLLSGIRFIPKEKKDSVQEDERGDKRERKRKHDKRHSSEKSKKKHHHDKHDRHDKDRHAKRSESRYDSDGSESSVDMEELAREEVERERMEAISKVRDHHSSTNRDRPVVVDNWGVPADQQGNNNSKFDPNRFKSLLNSLKKGNEPSAYELSESEPEESAYGHTPAQALAAIAKDDIVAPVLIVPTGTNQSAAALLRERLKNSKANLAASVPAPAPADFASNIGVNRDIVALKGRYNESQLVVESASNRKHVPGAPQIRKSKTSNVDIDIALDINTLKSREKAGGEDIDDIYRDNVLRMGERYMGTELGGKGAFGNGDKAGMDEEGEIDMRMFQRKEQSQADALQREANKAIKSQQQLRRAVENCRRCTESKVFHRSCVISTGENAYLRLKMDPDVLVEGHLEIVPISHVSSILQSDEETQVEIERFQSCLRRMYETQGKGVLFLETAVHFHSRPHAHIEVIPVEQGMEAEASMFFKEV